MINPGWFVGVSGARRLFMRWLVGELARLRSEGNGCPFLGPLWVARKAAISLELEWARWVFAAWTSWNRFPEVKA